MDPRPSARARGYDGRWDKARANFIALNPRCCIPGCPRPASHVDHRIPHKGDRAAFWNRANWQPICARHHNQKTAKLDGGFGRAPAPGATLRAEGCNLDGLPLDPAHPWNHKG